MMTTQTINLKCVNCGAKLSITPDIDRFACGYCGHELIVQRSGGIVALKDVTDAIKSVQLGTDKTAAELAMKRLEGEITQLEFQKRVAIIPLKKRLDNLNLISIVLAAFFGIIGLSVIGGVIKSNTASFGSDPVTTVLVVLSIPAFLFTSYLGFNLYRSKKLKIQQEMWATQQNYDHSVGQLRTQWTKNRQIVDM